MMAERLNYLRPDQLHALCIAVVPINEALNETCYQVGSSLERQNFRDVDVRVVMDDKRFAQLFGPDLNQDYRHATALWSLVCSMLSRRLSDETGLPVDFQIQARSIANATTGRKHDKPRVALFDIPLPAADATHTQDPHHAQD